MINEQKTYDVFGYYSKEVTSHKKVVAYCPSCNSDRRKHSEETKKKIGLSNSISQPKGKTHPLYGIKKTDSFKEKIKESNKNRIWKDESRRKLSEKHKGKKLSEEHKKKIGRSGVNSHRYGKVGNHGKGEFYIRKNGEKIWMRSSWEIKIAKYLDSKDYNWSYEPTAFPIKYVFNNIVKEGTFRPDFLIQNLNEYWEIKGWWRDDSKEKYEAFVEQYKDLKIILLMKNNIKELGIQLR